MTTAAPNVDSYEDTLERLRRIRDTVGIERLVTPKRVVNAEKILGICIWVMERPLQVVISGKDTVERDDVRYNS